MNGGALRVYVRCRPFTPYEKALTQGDNNNNNSNNIVANSSSGRNSNGDFDPPNTGTNPGADTLNNIGVIQSNDSGPLVIIRQTSTDADADTDMTAILNTNNSNRGNSTKGINNPVVESVPNRHSSGDGADTVDIGDAVDIGGSAGDTGDGGDKGGSGSSDDRGDRDDTYGRGDSDDTPPSYAAVEKGKEVMVKNHSLSSIEIDPLLDIDNHHTRLRIHTPRHGTRRLEFDRVFMEDDSQERVFQVRAVTPVHTN